MGSLIVRILLLIFVPLTSVSAQTPFGEVRVFIDVDRALVQNAGGTEAATRFVNELVASTDAIFRKQLGLTLTLAGVHLFETPDSFDPTTNSTLLASFSSYAETIYRRVEQYDVAVLLVGSALGGSGGVAYQASACGTIETVPLAYAVIQPALSDEYNFNAHLLAHELGHTLDAEHDDFPDCRADTIMCPAQIGDTYSSTSKERIAAYVTSRHGAGCFPSVLRSDPTSNLHVSVLPSGSSVKYQITGAAACTSLDIVGAPSRAGLGVMFGYLRIGRVLPSNLVKATSRSVTALTGGKRLYLGARCNGELSSSVAVLNSRKLKPRKITNSAVLALRSLQRGFR